jgi:integrase
MTETRLRLEITDPLLRGLKPPPKGSRITIQDDRQPKLFLRVSSKGTCTWSVLGYLPDGERVRPTLGKWPAISIANARRKAEGTIGDLSRGISPTKVKREARRQHEARKGEPTVAARLAQWLAVKGNEWKPSTLDEHQWLCRRYVEPKLGKRPLVETTRRDWTDLLADLRARAPGSASCLYGVVSSFSNFCDAHGWITAPLLPRRGKAVIAPDLPARERVLSDAELAAVWRASEQVTARARAYIQISILTGARQMEVADIAAGEVDRDAGRWRLPGSRSKNGQAYTMPLGPLALAALGAVWPPVGVSGSYRLLGQIKGGGFRNFSVLKRHIDAASGVTGWRWHDARRTCRTGLSRLGVRPDIAELALNHVTARGDLVRVYDRHDYADEIIAALAKWQDHIAKLLRKNDAEREGIHLIAAEG